MELANIKPTKNILPPRIMFYGPEKIGKTELLAAVPNNIFFELEKGSNYINVARYPEKITTHEEFMQGLKALYDQKHNFTSLSVDALDNLEALVFDRAAKEHGKQSIADVGYGAGYVTAQNIWRQTLEAFDLLNQDRKMAILMIAHSQIRRFDNPTSQSYDTYTIKLQEKDKGSSSASLLKEYVDATFFINNEVFVKEEDVGFKNKTKKGASGGRVIYTRGTAAFYAGHRSGLEFPPEIQYENPDQAWNVIGECMSKAMA